MIAWSRNAYLHFKSLSEVKGHICCSTTVPGNRLLWASKTQHSALLVRAWKGSVCARHFHTALKAGTHLIKRSSLGVVSFTPQTLGGCYCYIYFPKTRCFLPSCISSVVQQCHGLKHEAGLSIGIYQQRIFPVWMQVRPVAFSLHILPDCRLSSGVLKVQNVVWD